MIKSLDEPRCIVDSSGTEWCNYFCDNYIKIDAKVPDENLCANLKFKGPGYLNYSKVQSKKFLLVLINQSKKSWHQNKSEVLLASVSISSLQSYWWVGVPLIIYAIDRIIRWTRRFNPAVVYKAIEHPGPCLELRMRKKGWKQQAGQVSQLSVISYIESIL